MALRLFVAAYPPADVTARLLELCAGLGLAGLRAVPADQVHLTLQFIGDTAEREMDGVRESVARACSGLIAAEVEVVRLISLPRERARLVAVDLAESSLLSELHRRLVVRLARKVREKDRFLPHITVGRYQGLGAAVDVAVEPVRFRVERVGLVKSVLRPDRAEHRVMEWFEVG